MLYQNTLWEELGKNIDNVLYFDFDVVPNTTESFFEKFDMNKICVHAPNATKENVWTKTMLKNYKKGKDDFEKLMSSKLLSSENFLLLEILSSIIILIQII